MSPLARPFRIVLRYLPGAAILCGIACLVYPWGQSPFSDQTVLTAPAAACALCLLAATICLASALIEGVQAAPLLRSWGRMAPPSQQDYKPVFLPLGRVADGVMERAADAVKDALLDAGTEEDEPAPDPAHRPLPPLSPARLAEALREPVAQTLAAVAERVNAAPHLEGVAACDDEIRELFEALAGHALELAAGLRIDAAAERLPWPAAHGECVKKFRRMAVMESLASAEVGDAPKA